MTEHAYVALIQSPQQFDQVEDFVSALVREGAGYANDIGVLDQSNHFSQGALLVLFTADRGLIDACFHLEFGFEGPVHFEHLDAFETDGDEHGAEIVGFRSLADAAGDEADTPEQVFAYVRGLQGWSRGPRREAHADPVAYEEAADDWNQRLSEMLPVAAARKSAPARAKVSKAGAKATAKKKPVPKPPASKKPAAKKAAARPAQRASNQPVARAAVRAKPRKKAARPATRARSR